MINSLIKTATNPLTDAARQKISQEFARRLAQAGMQPHASSPVLHAASSNAVEEFFAIVGFLTIVFLFNMLILKWLPQGVKKLNRFCLENSFILTCPILPSFMRMRSAKMARIVTSVAFFGAAVCFTLTPFLILMAVLFGITPTLDTCCKILAYFAWISMLPLIYIVAAIFILRFRFRIRFDKLRQISDRRNVR